MTMTWPWLALISSISGKLEGCVLIRIVHVEFVDYRIYP